jgi:FkbM family methyltransferase
MKLVRAIKDKLISDFDGILTDYLAIEYGQQVTTVDAVYAYRILLGRMPALGDELETLISNKSTWREFINGLLDSKEFSNKLDFLPNGKRLMSESNGFRFWFDTMDRDMGAKMAAGDYEPETASLIKKIIQPGMVCLDIGAQTGFYTCMMAQLAGTDGEVIAFEPMDRSFDLLNKNIEENGWQDRVSLHHVACSDSTGEISVGIAAGMVVANANGSHVIKSLKIDDMKLNHVDFCKIDIEGHEPKAISGMESLLRVSAPVVLTEVNQYWLAQAGSSASEYMDLLNDKGYMLFDIERGFIELKKYEPSSELENINILAIPKARRAEILRLQNTSLYCI